MVANNPFCYNTNTQLNGSTFVVVVAVLVVITNFYIFYSCLGTLIHINVGRWQLVTRERDEAHRSNDGKMAIE